MAKNVIARKNSQWIVVSKLPDVCKTPMGAGTPPVPYPVIAKLNDSLIPASTVNANGNPIVVFDSTHTPTTIGDEPGSAKGIKSGTVGGNCWPKDHSSSLRARGRFVVRHNDEFWMNGN
jgi:hypothetical protein